MLLAYSVLAEIEAFLGPALFHDCELGFALFHQLLTHRLRTLHRQREAVHFAVNAIPEFLWKVLERADLVDVLGPPVELLRRDVGG
jgi:hypothetical protein